LDRLVRHYIVEAVFAPTTSLVELEQRVNIIKNQNVNSYNSSLANLQPDFDPTKIDELRESFRTVFVEQLTKLKPISGRESYSNPEANNFFELLKSTKERSRRRRMFMELLVPGFDLQWQTVLRSILEENNLDSLESKVRSMNIFEGHKFSLRFFENIKIRNQEEFDKNPLDTLLQMGEIFFQIVLLDKNKTKHLQLSLIYNILEDIDKYRRIGLRLFDFDTDGAKYLEMNSFVRAIKCLREKATILFTKNQS
jgi:hypothetical protein